MDIYTFWEKGELFFELHCWLYVCKEKDSSCDLTHCPDSAARSQNQQLQPVQAAVLCTYPTWNYKSGPNVFSFLYSFIDCFWCVPASAPARSRVALSKRLCPKAIPAAGNSQGCRGIASDPKESNLKGRNEIMLHSQVLTYAVGLDTDYVHTYLIVWIFSHD